MKKLILSIFFCFGVLLAMFAQSTPDDLRNTDRDFLYVNTQVNTKAEVNQLSKNFSVDNCHFDARSGQYQVKVYLARHEYEGFLAQNLPFEIITPERPPGSSMVSTSLSDFTANWNKYPAYDVYVQLMHTFETNFPDICKIDTILAATPNPTRPHMLLAAHISSTLGQPADKPAFFYSSTMHGDEVVGYYMMLQLINYILNNATTDPQVQNILQNVDLYICPLENPDGTYKSSNTQISSSASQRYNYNNVDLNRNYPFVPGISGSANVQPETQAVINWVADKHFVMSVNFHGGAELTNYPWDSWETADRAHPDADWFQYICHGYVDRCHEVDASYMVGETAYQPGCGSVTEGGDWYVIDGSRQDYMNYYQHCREVTIEAHFDKVVTSTSELPTYWTNSKVALLSYIEECLYGFRGIVTDAVTGEPVEAKIFVNNHDTFNSEVYSHQPVGNYHRPIKAGTYSVTVSADCYEPQTFTVTTADGACVRHDVQLQPLVAAPQVADQHIPVGATATLTANSTHTIKWFASANAATPLATGNTFTTPVLTQTTIYYVEEQAISGEATCVSERVPVTVYVILADHDTVTENMTVEACGSYTINGQTFTISGCYSFFFPYAAQNYNDSILMLSLTIHPTYYVTDSNSYVVGDTYPIGSDVYTATVPGIFTYDVNLQSVHGCDSIIHYIVVVRAAAPVYSDLYAASCVSYTYEGETFTASGDYNFEYPAQGTNFADSILTLHLTIYPSYSQNVVNTVNLGDVYYVEDEPHIAVAVGTFAYDRIYTTVNGCDSIIHYIFYVTSGNEVFGDLTLDECSPFIYEGEVLIMDGDYTFYYPGAGVGGVDSTLIIHLTLHPSYESTVNLSLAPGEHVQLGDYDFYSDQAGIFPLDKEYQTVYGCDSIIHYNITVGNVGIEETTVAQISIYPNPVQNECTISGLVPGIETQIRVYNAYGQLVWSENCLENETKINFESIKSGIYYIQLIQNEFQITQKIIKY